MASGQCSGDLNAESQHASPGLRCASPSVSTQWVMGAEHYVSNALIVIILAFLWAGGRGCGRSNGRAASLGHASRPDLSLWSCSAAGSTRSATHGEGDMTGAFHAFQYQRACGVNSGSSKTGAGFFFAQAALSS